MLVGKIDKRLFDSTERDDITRDTGQEMLVTAAWIFVHGYLHPESVSIIVQQDATMYSLLL